MVHRINGWSIVYKRAEYKDGSLLFPSRLSKQFLEKTRRVMGSYKYANQYLNKIIPEGEQTFKKEWLRYYQAVPDVTYSFCFIDPAISEASTADFTGVTIVSVDCEQNWYVKYAQRHKINPSQIIELMFRLHDEFRLNYIGVEDVAFQRAIVHFAYEEMKRRGKQIPVNGVKRGTDKTKEMRILGLVPRFEFGSLYLKQGLKDLEDELAMFPRGAHDDLLDSLASLDQIVYYPPKPRSITNGAPHPSDPKYESYWINKRYKEGSGTPGSDY